MILMKGSNACPNFYFHLTFTGTQTFYFENINNPADHVTRTGTGSLDAWSFNSSLGGSCGMTFGANICYKIKHVGGSATAEIIGIKFTGSNPNHLTLQYDLLTETFSVTNAGNISAYTLTRALVPGDSPICSSCTSGIYILDNYVSQDDMNSYPQPLPIPMSFTTVLTESSTQIIFENTIIAAGSVVRVDADPVNGYIIFFEGFEVKPGAVFVAKALDGCGPLIPN